MRDVTGLTKYTFSDIYQVHPENLDTPDINVKSPNLRGTGKTVNFLDKYSDSENAIAVKALQKTSEIMINVEDHGSGIAQKHLPRLFERFYRVGKARSRQLGGTGLGLAIVKHIAQAHGGRVSVESTLGKGSIFTIHLSADSL